MDEDPYWEAVLDDKISSNKDFMANDSFSLNSMVLLLNNLSTLIFTSEMIFPFILSKYWTVMLLMLIVNVATIVTLSVMIYKGTTFNKMFCKTNQIIMACLLLVMGSATVWTLLEYNLLSPYKPSNHFLGHFRNSVIILSVVNVMHLGYVMLQFIYFGSIKKSLDANSDELIMDHKEAHELDEHIDFLKENHPERFRELQRNTQWINQFDLPDQQENQEVDKASAINEGGENDKQDLFW